MSEVLMCHVTCPNVEAANVIAAELVKNNLCACVNIVPEIRSLYKWEGNVEND